MRRASSLPYDLDDARVASPRAHLVVVDATAPPGGPRAPSGPSGPSEDDDTVLETRAKTTPPKRYKVVFHNDDFTTQEFVIDVLRRFFHKNESEAVHVMLTVHTKGRAVAGVYTRDIAETKTAEVMKHARTHGMPLMLTTEAE